MRLIDLSKSILSYSSILFLNYRGHQLTDRGTLVVGYRKSNSYYDWIQLYTCILYLAKKPQMSAMLKICAIYI